MKTSSLTIVEALTKKLLTYSTLVDSLQKKDYSFLGSLEKWMRDVEEILKTNNIASCSEIAGLRSKILAPVFNSNQKMAAKKMQLKIASEVLYDLQSSVLSVLKPHKSKVDEARDLLLQLLRVVEQSKTIRFNSTSNFQTFINQVWEIISMHDQLKPLAIKLLTLLPKTDVLRIIAEEIILEEWS